MQERSGRRGGWTVLAAGLAAAVLTGLAGRARGGANEATVITIGSKVLVKETVRFGINLGGDAYYSGAALVKDRARENFEGTSYRRCHFGPGSGADGASTWFGGAVDWEKILAGGTYTILSGPGKWASGTIKGVTTRQFKHQGKLKPFRYFLWDKPQEPLPVNGGFMVEKSRLKDGSLRTLDGFWTSKQNEVAIGDVPPGSFGCAALKLKGADEKAHFRFGTYYQRYGENNGRWHVRFWAKGCQGAPKLRVVPDRYGEPAELAPTGEWKRHEVALTVADFPEPAGPGGGRMPFFTFEASGGDVLIDDVSLWREGDANPTAFRDDCVAMLRRFHPGPVRYLQMGGSTIDNTLAAPLRSHRYASRPGTRLGPYTSHQRDPYSLHEMYVLCEHIGAEPWYCLPGTLTREEMSHFMEYLGAPAGVGYGRKRAEMGQRRPWTEVFAKIHVEFGNEAWNSAASYQCGGFNGADYWHDLIATGKASKHYKPNVVFHAAGQAAYVGRNEGIMKNCPNADRFSVAPYIIQGFSKADYTQHLNTDEKLFRWAFAWAIRRSRSADGAMHQNHELARKADMELSIYEVNHHTTHGDGPLEPRNRLVTSIGGGLNVCNNMLTMMKDHHLRTQCLFSLAQHSYRARGIGAVRLWGTALCMRKGKERYRPTFLACATANKVIGGDLVETVHTGADPTFEATGPFRHRKPAETIGDLPILWSYAFAEGKRRALILVSLDTQRPRPVVVKFAGRVAGGAAKRWLLTGEKITANNEYEVGRPEVTVRADTLADFASGKPLTLPPHAMLALEWRVQ